MTMAEFTSQTTKKGERLVIVTFDDGYADNYTVAFPILKRYGFVATVFLVSDYVNTDHVYCWDLPAAEAQGDLNPYRLLSWGQIHEMAAYGIEFGSHTCTHPQLTQLTTQECWTEIVRSRVDLQARLGREVVSFCYPRGDLNAEVVQMVRQAGYRSAVVTLPRPVVALSRYTHGRVGIYRSTSPLLFRLKTMPWVTRIYFEHLARAQ